jgi:hypothetical protein
MYILTDISLIQKTCFKCASKKVFWEYYKHSAMGDGYLNKCKDCTKLDVSKRNSELSLDPVFIAKERARGREKYYRLEYKGHKVPIEKKRLIIQRSRAKFPEKYKAAYAAQRVVKVNKLNNNHHWSYNKEHHKDVIELSVKDHFKLHRYITYDPVLMMYRRIDNNSLLDTKELHLEYFNEIKDKP